MELKEKVPNYEELGIDMQWYLDKLLDGYSRVLFIDDGLCDQERLVILSERTATELKLRHERRMGSLEVLINGLAHTKALALANIGDNRQVTDLGRCYRGPLMNEQEKALRKEVTEEIERFVREDPCNRLELDGMPIYGAPLVSFASGTDPSSRN